MTKEDSSIAESDVVGLLFEAASDSRSAPTASRVVPLWTLIGDPEETKVRAYELTRRVLAGEPRHRGLQQLGVFEELVIGEFVELLHAIQVHRFLAAEGFAACRFSRESKWSRRLSRLKELDRSQTAIEVAAGGRTGVRSGRLARSLARVASAKFSIRALRQELGHAVRQADPYRRSRALAFWRRKKPPSPGGAWFYTTAYTFTRIGLLYEPYAPEKFRYLVENEETGGAALRDAARGGWSLYDFTRAEHRPTPAEIAAAREKITRHVQAVTLEGDARLARELFVEGAWYGEFCGRLLGLGLFQTSLCREFLDQAKPDSVWVGNPVFEHFLLAQATERRIPTIGLQHGVLGDFCQLSASRVDHYIVRGPFWRDFLSADAQQHAKILNPPEKRTKVAAKTGRGGHVLFLTGRPVGLEFAHEAEIVDLLRTVVRATAGEGRALVVRVHPLERIPEYQAHVAKALGELGLPSADVSYSQGGSLEELVGGSCCAVTYNSTVFLDCLRLGVPMISFGWHHFSFKRQIEALGVFNFAESLAHLESLVRSALSGALKPCGVDVTTFLAATDGESLRGALGGLAAAGSSGRA